MRSQIGFASRTAPGPEAAFGLGSQLAQQEIELVARRHLLKNEIAGIDRDGRDSAEYSADQAAFGVNAALLAATARTMRGIEEAIERLRSKTYGTCIDCSGQIPSPRLQALPFAERCRECQEGHDEEQRAQVEIRYRSL